MEFLLPEEAAPITSRGNCTPQPLPLLLRLPIPSARSGELYPFFALLLPLSALRNHPVFFLPSFSSFFFFYSSSHSTFTPMLYHRRSIDAPVRSRWFIENWKPDDCRSSPLSCRSRQLREFRLRVKKEDFCFTVSWEQSFQHDFPGDEKKCETIM